MEPDQTHPEAAPLWQAALNPRLVDRLARPLTRPGVIAPGMSRTIIARMQHTGAHMPLLDRALQRMRSVEDPQAAHLPIVYARPAPAPAPPANAAAPPTIAHPVVQPKLAQPFEGAGPVLSPAHPPTALPVVRASAQAAEPQAGRPEPQPPAIDTATVAHAEPPQSAAAPSRSNPAPVAARPMAPAPAILRLVPAASPQQTQSTPPALPLVPPPATLPLIQQAQAAPPIPGGEPQAAGDAEPVRIVLPPGRRVAHMAAASPPIAPAPLPIQRAPIVVGLPSPGPVTTQPAGAAPPELPLAQRYVDGAALAPGDKAVPPGAPAMSPQSAQAVVTPLRTALPALAPPSGAPALPPPLTVVQRRVATAPQAAAVTPLVVGAAAPGRLVVAPVRRAPQAEQAPLQLSAAGPIEQAGLAARQAPTIQRSADPPSLQAASAAPPPGPQAELPTVVAGEGAAQGLDLNLISAQVYEMLVRRIASERERRGR